MDGSDAKSDSKPAGTLEPIVDTGFEPVFLKGGVQKHGKKGTLGGQVDTHLDPDAGSNELLIEWDIWRNKVSNQISRNLSKHMNGWGGYEVNAITRCVEPKFPSGIQAGVDFVISDDRKVLKVEIKRPSGYPEYDQLIMKSIFELSKKRQEKLLRFPEHSRRTSVEQMLGFQRVHGQQRQPFLKFGDTERVQLSN